MAVLPAFHDVRFPTDIALGSAGGPVRRTEIIELASGREQRNARWKHARRRYNAGYGVKTLAQLQEVIAFFEERRGRQFGFRFRDPVDHQSSMPGLLVQPTDQAIGIGDGQTPEFQLVKSYGSGETAYRRVITKPVAESVKVAVGGMQKIEGTDYTLDATTGLITFQPGNIPPIGEAVYAGFEFDVPVRFDSDELTVNVKTFLAGDIAAIPLIEIL